MWHLIIFSFDKSGIALNEREGEREILHCIGCIVHWQHTYVWYTRCPKKAERSIFVTLIFENIAVVISSDKTLSSEKNDTKIIEIGWVVLILWSFLKTVIFNFCFILVTFQSGIMAFLTSIHCCPEAHWSVQTKQRENLWTAIPAVNISRRFNKICKWLSRNGCRINTTGPNQTILVSFFSEDNVLSDEIKICYIFEYQSNENQAFWGTPGIKHIIYSKAHWQIVWHSIPVATPHFGGLFYHNFQGTKSMKITICSIFAALGNYQGQYFKFWKKLLLNTAITQNLEYRIEYWQNVTNWCFSQRPELRRPCGNPTTVQGALISLHIVSWEPIRALSSFKDVPMRTRRVPYHFKFCTKLLNTAITQNSQT